MCSTALGAGVVPPFDKLYDEGGMMFASAVSDEFKSIMRRASFTFNEATASEETALRRQAQSLEVDLTNGSPGAHDELLVVRDQLDSKRYPYCNDYAATRDLVVELAKQSRHKHITVLDDQGFRLSTSLKYSPTFARESTFLGLTVGYGMHQAVTRINGTGGITSTNFGNGINPVCSYFASPPAALVKKMSAKLCSSTLMSPMQGHAVIIDAEPIRRVSIDATTEDVVKLLDTYYTIGHLKKEDRAQCVLQSDELKVKWERFLTGDDVFKILDIPANRLDRADKLLKHWHVKPKVAAAYATRAAMCQAALETIKIAHNDNHRSIALRDCHLEQAIEFFKELYSGLMVKVQNAERLADNAASARAARAKAIPSPARQEAVLETLIDAIEKSPNRMISRDAAIRLHGVTAAMLEYLVENSTTLVELLGRDQIKMGKTQRAYALRKDMSTDLGEALDDLREAEETFARAPDDPMFDDMENVRHELMALAKELDRDALTGLPAVPITKMSTLQIMCLPAILTAYPDCFVMRGTPKCPEMPQLVKSVTDPDAQLEAGVPTVWVRRGKDGKPFRNWGVATKLGFADVWAEQPT